MSDNYEWSEYSKNNVIKKQKKDEERSEMKKMKRKIKSRYALRCTFIIILLLIAFIIFKMSIAIVPAGYAGVKYNMSGGVEGDTLSQGWHLKSPTVKVTFVHHWH